MADESRLQNDIHMENVSNLITVKEQQKQTHADDEASQENSSTPPKKRGRKRKMCNTDEPNVSTPAAISGEESKKEPASTGRKRGRPPKKAKRVWAQKNLDKEVLSTCQENEKPNGKLVTPPVVSREEKQLSRATVATTPVSEEQTLDSVSTGRKRGRPAKVVMGDGTPKRGRPRKNLQPKNLSAGSDEELPQKPAATTPVVSRSGRVIRTPMSCQEPKRSLRSSVENLSTPTSKRVRRKSCPNENEQSKIEEAIEENPETLAEDESQKGLPENEGNKRRKGAPKVKIVRNVVCGVCKKEMLEPNFVYHRYSVHQGLARLEGQSQEFTDQEKASELKKTLDRLKKLHCSNCSAAFTTLLGYQYHIKRCGRDPSDLEDMLKECTVCGKKVMSLLAHLKTHEKRPEPKFEISKERDVSTPDGKSKRAAAVKAATLLREIKDELSDAQPKEHVKKALKYIIEPPSQKVSNSIIAAWKKQISASSKANCRYPSCEFSSDDIDQLREHHINCETGAKSQSYGCLKCSFRHAEKNSVVEHVFKVHVTEAEFEPADGSSSDEDDDSSGDEESLDEDEDGEGRPRNRSIPHNSKFLDKAYGLSQGVLAQFKGLMNHNIVPKWLAQYHKKHFTWDSLLFTTWKPKKREIIKSPEKYLPTLEHSLPFARRNITNCPSVPLDISYEKLNRFEAIIQDSTPVFFCGGPIESAAWCPMPLVTPSETTVARDQYLAVSAFREEHQFRSSMISPFAEKYIIQIWNCGKLPSQEATTAIPKLEIGLAHEFGRIWCLRWCPSGCYDSERLGILAAACSDGTIRCFAVPNPVSFVDKSSEPIYMKVEPSVTLKLKMEERSECTSLNWDDMKGHRFIVGGFANGTVGVWDLQTKSPMLMSGDTLYPIWSFYAHSCAITAVSLDPHHGNARFLATASTDRTVKLWDRTDFSVPICCSKRSRVTDIKWRRHWPGVILCVDDFCQLFRTSTLFYDFGYTGNRQGILPQNSVVWSTAENEFLDIIAHCTDAGEVVMFPSHFAVIDSDEKKLRRQRKIIFRTDLIETETDQILNRMQKIYAQSTKKAITSVKSESQAVNKKYALVFNELPYNRGRHFGNNKQPHIKTAASDTMDILLPNDEPHTSIRAIVFNPNFESHTWMCVCGENGLVHLLRIETPSLARVANYYVNEINSD